MSTEQKPRHTPGPWRVVPIGNERYVESDSYHLFICDMQRNECPNEAIVAQCDANAHLIAAAPELLEACKLVQKAIRSAGLLDVKKRFDLCVADAALGKAIAKAT